MTADLSMDARLRRRTLVIPGGCWLWLGYRGPLGYGRVHVGRKSLSAHRAAYEAWVGPIPDGLVLDHLCVNPPCVNPAHLEPVTNVENILRGYRRRFGYGPSGLPLCPHGHEYTEENTHRTPKGHVRCRACRREQQAHPFYEERECLECGGKFATRRRPRKFCDHRCWTRYTRRLKRAGVAA